MEQNKSWAGRELATPRAGSHLWTWSYLDRPPGSAPLGASSGFRSPLWLFPGGCTNSGLRAEEVLWATRKRNWKGNQAGTFENTETLSIGRWSQHWRVRGVFVCLFVILLYCPSEHWLCQARSEALEAHGEQSPALTWWRRNTANQRFELSRLTVSVKKNTVGTPLTLWGPSAFWRKWDIESKILVRFVCGLTSRKTHFLPLPHSLHTRIQLETWKKNTEKILGQLTEVSTILRVGHHFLNGTESLSVVQMIFQTKMQTFKAQSKHQIIG